MNICRLLVLFDFSYHLMQKQSDILSAAYFAASIVENSIIKSPLYSAKSEFQKGNNITSICRHFVFSTTFISCSIRYFMDLGLYAIAERN